MYKAEPILHKQLCKGLQCCCRKEAVGCLGLLGLLPGSTEAEAVCSQRLALLRTALIFDSAPQVQEIAAQALCDLVLIRCCSCHMVSFIQDAKDAITDILENSSCVQAECVRRVPILCPVHKSSTHPIV